MHFFKPSVFGILKSSLREDQVGYECTSEILVKARLIFSGVELLATSHMILTKTIKVNKR